jgi:hypothetical protein
MLCVLGATPEASTLSTLIHDCAVQAIANRFREGIQFTICVELDRLASRVHCDEAMFAPGQVFVEIAAQGRADFVIEQIVEQCHEL